MSGTSLEEAIMKRPEFDEKHLQRIALRLDPMYADISRYIDIVKNFIAERGGVIYGGTAIDYALRLRGDAIYDDADLAVPDLDFYMPDSVAAAYQLAEIIHRARADADSRDIGQTRAIVAMHVETMRVDCGDNHFIADISYFPEPLFSRLPTITYSGMRCVHPDYQRADIHSALSFPFDNAPLEVIFARWKKDILRLNKIDALYPITRPGEFEPPLTETHPLDEKRPLFGWAAYAALMSGQPCPMPVSFAIIPGKGPLRATFHTKRGIEYAAHDEVTGQRYARYVGLMLPRTEAGQTIYYDTSNRLLSVVRVRRDSRDILCACPQSVLQYMLAAWFIHGDSAALMAYCNLWECVVRGDAPHYKLSIETYGSTNIDSSQLAQIARLENQPTDLPVNYYPERQCRELPTFSYNSDHFKIQGEIL